MKNFPRLFKLVVINITVLTLLGSLAACTKGEKAVENPDEAKAVINLYPAYTEENGVRKWGLINAQGDFVVQPAYDGMEWQAGSRWVQIFVKGVEQGQASEENSLFTPQERFKVGLIERHSGRVILAPNNLAIGEFSEGLATVQVSEKKSLVIDEQGKVIFETEALLGSFHEGLVKFQQNGEQRYGYLNQKGEMVISPVYLGAGDFSGGKALVMLADGQQALIDMQGEVLCRYNFAQVKGMAEGLIGYFDSVTGKWGYASPDGKEVLAPTFAYVDNFADGLAVVAQEKCGVINQAGEFVIKPEYNQIISLEEGYYAALQGDLFLPNPKYFAKAIFNPEGKQITDFCYYEIGPYQDGYVSVCDGKATYFLDQNGHEVKDLPKVADLGRLEKDGDLIRAQFAEETRYYTQDGSLVWAPQASHKFGNLRLKKERYQPGWTVVSYYPQVEGLQNVALQSAINRQIREAVENNLHTVETEDIEGSFAVDFTEDYLLHRYGDLLVINYRGYLYPVGAAHGVPTARYNHLNIQDGTFYQLSDLFQKDAPYLERITGLINRQIQEWREAGDETIGLENFAGFAGEPVYELTPEELKIYFRYFELEAPTAAGIIEFAIPYGELSDILDTQGALWRAFH